MKLNEITSPQRNPKESYKKLTHHIKSLKLNTDKMINDYSKEYAYLFDDLGKSKDKEKLIHVLKLLNDTLKNINV